MTLAQIEDSLDLLLEVGVDVVHQCHYLVQGDGLAPYGVPEVNDAVRLLLTPPDVEQQGQHDGLHADIGISAEKHIRTHLVPRAEQLDS